mmetsp:Transcript_130067/g.253342  ORF Transcript_130067/g.253342 Transcript_130067/m.253342 type:complete len:245 (-) Transcript_130067:346-1080(-)
MQALLPKLGSGIWPMSISTEGCCRSALFGPICIADKASLRGPEAPRPGPVTPMPVWGEGPAPRSPHPIMSGLIEGWPQSPSEGPGAGPMGGGGGAPTFPWPGCKPRCGKPYQSPSSRPLGAGSLGGGGGGGGMIPGGIILLAFPGEEQCCWKLNPRRMVMRSSCCVRSSFIMRGVCVTIPLTRTTKSRVWIAKHSGHFWFHCSTTPPLETAFTKRPPRSASLTGNISMPRRVPGSLPSITWKMK